MGTSDGLRVDIRSDTGAVPANGGNMSTTDESREGIGGNSRPAPEGARDFLTPREVASRVGVSYHSILRAIRRGELAAFLVVGRLRIETCFASRCRSLASTSAGHTAARRGLTTHPPSGPAGVAPEHGKTPLSGPDLQAIERDVA